MKQMRFLISAVFLLCSVTALGGEVLHFKAGNINTTEKSMKSQFQMTDTQFYVVQFKNSVKESDKQFLYSFGAKIFRYVPDDAFIVMAESSVANSIARQDRVQTVIPYYAELKMDDDYSTLSVFDNNNLTVSLIQAFDANLTNNIRTQISHLPQAEILYAGGKFLVVRMPRSQVVDVAHMDGIEWIQPYTKMQLFDRISNSAMRVMEDGSVVESDMKGDYTDLSGYETGTKVMKFEAAWQKGFTGLDQIAAIADTGLDSGNAADIHVDFMGAVKKGYALGIGGNSWADPMGHGTHVAGSVLGRGTASGGLLRGGAYNSQLVFVGMWSDIMDNIMIPAALKDIFEPTYIDGARVHSNSWGSSRNLGAYDSYASQVDAYMWDFPDMLIVFAAGNSGVDANKDGRIDSGSVSSPGTAKNVLTVGASENLLSKGGIQVPINKLKSAKDSWPVDPINSDYLSNNANGMACFSSRGPTTDGRIKPEIVAPGTNVLSTRSHVQGSSELWGAYNKDYTFSGGTSMATPLTAGAAVVTRDYLIKNWKIANPTAAIVKAVLLHTADDMYPGQYGEVGASRGQELLTHRPNNDEGYGRVDMANVVGLGANTQIIDHPGIAPEETIEYKVNVNNGHLLATLSYTDAPAAVSASKCLVNDLDLVVIDAKGATHTLNDSTNNTEMLDLTLPNGLTKIQVKGTKVPQTKAGKMPFALVFTVN